MRGTLLKWIGDADALRRIGQFSVPEVPLGFSYQRSRQDDLYIALVGELFERMSVNYHEADDWARLGNALVEYTAADRAEEIRRLGVAQNEAALFAAAAFYLGGFPASAYLVMRNASAPGDGGGDEYQACRDLLARPRQASSAAVRNLVDAISVGELQRVASLQADIVERSRSALETGPDEWIPLRLLEVLLERFRVTNVRAVLPEGNSEFWTPLVKALVKRGTWDFFPSQIEAIRKGLLSQHETFSLQMPTSSGKTTLCETLLFAHLTRNPTTAAVLLVPYRSLASELRSSLVSSLNQMGISARCAYGGTVPSGDEVRAFDDARALVATPETLTGILGANPSFAERISLVICDEGHLLDADSRGIGLELLLARMRVRASGVRRFVFVSAIVPNVEEINSWLGGSADSVVKSEYRPAIAEFSVLRPTGKGATSRLDLDMHPHEASPIRYSIEGFLRRSDFQSRNPATSRLRTYDFSTLKARAVASARKALPMGAAVVFAANKRGNQGAIGIAEELLFQLPQTPKLPNPSSFAKPDEVGPVAEYMEKEYGDGWICTRALRAGAVLHHGDIPQETREVLERLLRLGGVAMGVCTSTLAEGVNLPIRTLVLYSVQRVGKDGVRRSLLTRDIRNLVGRAGRAGSTTKGLVICANDQQWPLVEAVARQSPGEPVHGALSALVARLRKDLALTPVVLTNDWLERDSSLHSLIDGIDSNLVELAAAEIGDEELVRLASELAAQTFASRQADEGSKQILGQVFGLRARRVAEVRSAGRLDWVRSTGARTRMVDPVGTSLLPMRQRWDDVVEVLDPTFVTPVLEWAWAQPEMQASLRDAYRVDADQDLTTLREPFFAAIRAWLAGAPFTGIAAAAKLEVDEMLAVHSQAVAYSLQVIVEQAIALLEKFLQSQGQTIAPVVLQFPEHLRFGVPTTAGVALAAGGVRHRRACVELGRALEADFRSGAISDVFRVARDSLRQFESSWRKHLGDLVFGNTRHDLSVGGGSSELGV